MEKFKYLRIEDPTDEELNEYGDAGYELVTVIPKYDRHYYIFKKYIYSEDDCHSTPIDRFMQEAIKQEGAYSKIKQIKYIKERLDISVSEAKKIVDKYWENRPKPI